MNPKTLAAELDGYQFRDMRLWMRDPMLSTARANNLVIVCGYSDDVLKIKGAVEEEINVADGRINKRIDSKIIVASFEKGTWTIDVANGEPFNIYDGDRLFCRGMVFRLKG